MLGVGGVRMLRGARATTACGSYHMNEGHAALLVLALLRRSWARASGSAAPTSDLPTSRSRAPCVFTTHTPVPAGHDQFPLDLVRARARRHGDAVARRAPRSCLRRRS